MYSKFTLAARGKPSTIVYRAEWLVEPFLCCQPARCDDTCCSLPNIIENPNNLESWDIPLWASRSSTLKINASGKNGRIYCKRENSSQRYHVRSKFHQKCRKIIAHKIDIRSFIDRLGCLRILLMHPRTFLEARGHVSRNFTFDQFSTNFRRHAKPVLQ